MNKDVSVLLRKIQLAKAQCLGQPWTLTRRSCRHMSFLDKSPPISTQNSKIVAEVGQNIIQRGQLDCICSYQTHRRASRCHLGHRDARQEIPGGNLEIHVLFSLVLFENNMWQNSQIKMTGPFSVCFLPCNLLFPSLMPLPRVVHRKGESLCRWIEGIDRTGFCFECELQNTKLLDNSAQFERHCD